MVSKFREVYKAVAYVCSGLRERCSNEGRVYVAFFPRGPGQCDRKGFVDLVHVTETLDRLTAQFPSASAVIHSDDNNGFCGIIQCRCDHESRKRCSQRCAHHAERPVIWVMQPLADRPPSAEETASALEAMVAEIHEYQKEYIKNHHSEFKHHAFTRVHPAVRHLSAK